VLADNLGPVIDAGFGALVPAHSTFYWWFIVTAFAFQIYCDFSGYSDIARGLARWMGYRFELNFDRPYSATSLRAFWGRWHISLSTWFRDYVYVPLGGSREGQHRAHLNMWATMLLSGFWHGAAWTFVIWGALHAFFLSLERLTRWPLALARARPLAIAVVLLQVWVAWVFFRASDVRQAVAILRIMFSFEGPSTFLVGGEDAAVFLLVGVLMEVVSKRHPEGLYQPPSWMGRWAEAAGVVAMLVAAVFLRGPGQAFIYFQF
jgi:alginate O-acetyltransferase complex protein AlgI